MDTIYAQYTVSMAEIENNFSQVLKESDGNTVAIFNKNKPEAYLVPAQLYETLIQDQELDAEEDYEDSFIVKDREKGNFIEVNINEL